MRIGFYHKKGDLVAWDNMEKMRSSIDSFIRDEDPDILMTREWSAPVVPLLDLLEGVADIKTRPGSLLVVNGRVLDRGAWLPFSETPTMGCVSVIGGYSQGERKTVFFPKRENGGTTSKEYGCPYGAEFGVPDSDALKWNNKQQPIDARVAKYHPPGYSRDGPATLGIDLGAFGKPLTWFPICADCTPVPESPGSDLVIYCSNGADLTGLEGSRDAKLSLCSDGDGGVFNIGLGGEIYGFIPEGTFPPGGALSVQKYGKGTYRFDTWEKASFSASGKATLLDPNFSIVELYANPFAAAKP